MAVLAFPSSAILDSTAAGRSILTAANAPAQRSLLELGVANSPTFVSQTLTGQSLTLLQAFSLLDLSTTWNTTGTPTAISLNVTDTASNAASLLVNLRVGGTSLFNIDKAGVVTVAQRIAFDSGAGTSPRLRRLGSSLDCVNNSETAFLPFRAGELWLGSSLALVLDASDILAQRRGAVAQAFRLYNTFTDTSNYERAKFAWESNVLRIGTERAGTGIGRNLEFTTGGAARLTIDANGSASFSGNISTATGQVQLSNVILSCGSSIVNFTGNLFQPVSLRVFNITDAFGINAEYGQFAWDSNVLRIGTVKTGTGVARALEFQTDGVTRLTLAATGAITASTRFNFAAPTTGASSANLPSGSDPSSPVQGDLWVNTSGDLRYRNASSTITLGSGGGGGVSDGDKGDITVSGSGATWTIDNDAVTYAKMQNVSSAIRILGRGEGSGSGDVQELTLGPNLTMTGTVLDGPETVENFAFSNIAVSGQSTVSADGSFDTLTLVAGSGISITTNATTDTVTISATGGGGGGGGLSRYTAIALGW